MNTDLASRLRDRLDQVEAVAKAASHVHGWIDSDFGRWKFDTIRVTAVRAPHEQVGHLSVREQEVCEPLEEAHGEHIAMHDPASVLRQVAASRKMLELHTPFEIPKYEYTGNPTIKIDANGREIRYWPPGSITGQRQVGAWYRCEHCETHDDDHREYPCPTVQALAEMWGLEA